MFIYIYIYAVFPKNVLVRPPHPRIGDSQGQETFLAPSADKQTCNYDTECTNPPPPWGTATGGMGGESLPHWKILPSRLTRKCLNYLVPGVPVIVSI